jgi:outer membrane protein assembly factor BamB
VIHFSDIGWRQELSIGKVSPLMMTRRRFLAATAATVAGSWLPPWVRAEPASPSDWLSHGFGPEQMRNNPWEREIRAETVSRLVPKWEFEAGSGITATPAVAGDRVIVGSWDGQAYCLDRSSGRRLWTFDAGQRSYPPDRRLGIFASAAVAGSTVYLASDRLIALSLETGSLLWERTIGAPDTGLEYFWAPPLVDQGQLYAGVSAGSETRTCGRIICVDTRTGALRWTFATVPEEIAGGSLIAPPSLDSRTRTLYAATGNPFHYQATGSFLARPQAGDHSSSLVALDAANGRLRWADPVHPHDTRNLDLNCPPMLVSAAGAGGRAELIIVGGKDGLRAWDRSTRRRRWHVQLTPALPIGGEEALPTTGPEAGPTAAAEDLVFFASNNHADKTCLIAGIEALSGEIRWLHSLPAFQFGPLSVAGGVVFLGLVDGKLRAWRARDGELLWESPAGPPIAGGPAIARGMVFVGSGAGQFLPGNRLRAFGLAS